MMLVDDILQSIIIADNVTGEVPLETKDVSQQPLVSACRHTIQTDPTNNITTQWVIIWVTPKINTKV